MCGFIGYLSNNEIQGTNTEVNDFMNMTNIISHRGPDDVGYYFDEHIRLGFRRLSIIDLDSGKQPLGYEDDRYWITFNGEIYNYLELREGLEKRGLSFKTDSDTEVILALYSIKREKALNELRGMFSFLIWDKEKKELFGARDHFGIKPFFYYESEDELLCASEKKSILLATNGGSFNEEALHYYLTYQFVPEPYTFSSSIKKLEPGHYFVKKIGQKMNIKNYFKPRFTPIFKPFDEEINTIRDVMRESVKVHMRSDVPVGSFLSGGIDSSSIVALAKEFNPKIKTFTVGFEREGYSEIDLAKETASDLGVENIHYIVKPEEFIEQLPKIIWHLDEPVADPALVPLFFVAREAKKHVTVVLSGEGADELFGGYNIYREPYSLRHFKKLPTGVKEGLNSFSKMLPDGTRGKSFLERGTTSIEDRYIGNAKIFLEAEKKELLKNYQTKWDYKNVTKELYRNIQHLDDVHKMQYIDMHTWLRGDILVKADKMTMANSLELRVPFLDKEVFKVASQLSSSKTITNQTTKYILRKAMEGIVPDSVLTRKKLGFPVPIRHWLQNELSDWAYSLIVESETDCLFNKVYLLNLLDDHQKGKKDYSRKLWTILTFMIWHKIYIEKKYNFSKDKILNDNDAKLLKV
ncbi:MAG: asparagine synthase (glutamine-hydrolyzing) [Bacillota bacterium]|uniref:asparagine synthase (glutamine-hydrolyzing) n=1 Tax=Fictibacillus TaxID=1329200 RepID=UPI0018CF56DA|nr:MULTISPECIES: asparagine synthase (glutamine-hydrolyzing) [unclassified Fictibacillus]MBH0157196.1 asparagine synthase (glutamine-hydrolyzing) [Fictibacillus sp. 5RED26]MBH0159517.1 asparagine synthase (glutamine-hydrolyzing) [Fictibacillus sp. 26RED30]MBH0163683.1 asparagine synthase (glutamine-hydrolyzing) [Fictibacillus sp. 7GRE50]MBH0169690.1 asparagine synthase (glutamine-hydrolyzing) [Fictibacillus sp. 18YEL24]MBH0174190.1 asparagine synthase (glutamine-hydrolyzing) [Fictibacillus sp.